MLASYLAEHAELLCVATVARRLVSIGKAHTTQGMPNPASTDLVRHLMRGLRRVYGRPQRQVAPAIKEDVLAMCAKLGNRPKDIRDRALILIGFAGAFRRSELCEINCNSISWTQAGIVILQARSKTDQEGEGRKVAIPFARGAVCPVNALKDWLEVSSISEGPIFRPVDRHGEICAGALSGDAVAMVVKQCAARAGLDPAIYSGHSLRAGLATSAAAAGVQSWKIRAQTGHKSDAMLARYIRDGELFRDNAAGAIL
jgi:integrase